MQVNEYIVENGVAEQSGKKKREEREMILAAQAEMEKLLDKDWKDGMSPHFEGVDICRVAEEMAR